jgi:hypothetical protein
MPTVTYRPPDVLHWFSTGSQEALQSAKRKGIALTKGSGESSVKQKIFQAASAAADFGRGAAADMVHRQAAETVYKLHDSHMDVRTPMSRQAIKYDAVSSIQSHGKDKFTLEYEGGTLTIRPIAHLSSGRIRVPVGWMRNEIEVPFTMLLQELSARCGLEIEPA